MKYGVCVFTLGPLCVAQLTRAKQSVYLSGGRTEGNEGGINNQAFA